uniref:Putative capsid protein n=1 Tax=viral metagenome TaxID=1070528 RepID=A0A6H1ZUX2_9ZZZZ
MNISNYVKGQNLTLQKPTSTNVELLIDKGKYFAFTLDDVDKVQFDIDAMDAWSDDASEQLKISIDSDVLNNIYSSVSSSNAGITAGAISSSFNLGTTAASIALDKTNIIDYILDCGTVLDESNIPETGRWMVITNWMANLISKSDQVMVRYSRN